MEPNELRLGNMVKPIIDGCVLTVIGIDCNGVQYDCEHHAAEIAEWHTIEPIQLTPEILERYGFTTIGKSKDYRLGNLILHTRKRGFVVRKSMPVIESLHQLQNLYFALNGEELKIHRAELPAV